MRYAIPRKDGGVLIMTTTDDAADPSAEIAKLHPDLQALIAGDAITPVTNIPADRTFRNAWKPDLSTDMVKARDIWRNRMRVARTPLLAALDVEYQKADEAQDVERKREIAARKQALRDVTAHPELEAAQTPEQLKAIWPDILPARK